MIAKSCTWILIFVIIVSVSSALENYMDYGNESPNSDKSANLRELFRMVQRSVDDSDGLRDFAEHLQPRAAERSPTLRLRFGRSYAKYPVGQLSRLNDGGSSASAFEEN